MRLVSYAQCLEDVLLHRALRHVERGFYVDVGAGYPHFHSVTRLFYERGWNGISIEPVPVLCDALRLDRPRDVVLNIAAAAVPGRLKFHEFVGTGLSTTVDRHAERHIRAGMAYRTYEIEASTLTGILSLHAKSDIHLLKIDVEGGEAATLQGCDFGRFRPWVAMVEATEPLTDTPAYAAWEPNLVDAGYRLAADDGLNRYYVAREHAELAAAFAFPADDYERAEAIRAHEARAHDAARLELELRMIKASRGWRLARRLERIRRKLSAPAVGLRRRIAALRGSAADSGGRRERLVAPQASDGSAEVPTGDR
jgi:FkbM family methyltransferase